MVVYVLVHRLGDSWAVGRVRKKGKLRRAPWFRAGGRE